MKVCDTLNFFELAVAAPDAELLVSPDLACLRADSAQEQQCGSGETIDATVGGLRMMKALW